MRGRVLARTLARLSILLLLVSASPAAAQSYTVVDLGTLDPGATRVIRGINTAGQFVGASTTFGTGHHGFLWKSDALVDLGALARSDWSIARGINELGTVVGSANTGSGVRAFIWSGGSA